MTPRLLPILALAAALAGCVDRLPDQDLRIRQATPVAKLTAIDLWREYQADRAAAERKYFGKAVEISGKPTSVDATTAGTPTVLFNASQADTNGVRARLLAEDAAAIVKAAGAGQFVTLRCYCEKAGADVILKSCVRP